MNPSGHSANIQLRIDRLVLDGFNLNPRERQQLQASIEAELGRLLGAQGLHPGLEQGLAVPALAAPPIQLAALHSGASTEQLGQQIAASVYGGIGHGPGNP